MGRETPFLGQQVRMEVQPKASWLPYEAAAVSSLPTGRQVWAFCPCKSRSSPPAAVSSPTVFKVAAGQLSPLRDSHLVHKEHPCACWQGPHSSGLLFALPSDWKAGPLPLEPAHRCLFPTHTWAVDAGGSFLVFQRPLLDVLFHSVFELQGRHRNSEHSQECVCRLL